MDDEALAAALGFTEQSARLGTNVTAELAENYSLSCELAARKPRPPRDPLAAVPPSVLAGVSSPLLAMSWTQFTRAVRGSAFHDIDKSLGLLRTAQSWLASEASFRDLTALQRKAIAGVIGVRERTLGDDLDQDWGWFGSMRGSGAFMKRIKENDRFLARAVDSIPQHEEVRKEHFERFVSLFREAFSESQRVGDLPTASRLLAMKRPDIFLCISKPNKAAAAEAMGFSSSGLELDGYWDSVVEVIRSSEWYNVDKPHVRNGELWECRAAMLDAIFYQPD